jgi:predicted lipoprotein with Yx(FWY)xxD motif
MPRAAEEETKVRARHKVLVLIAVGGLVAAGCGSDGKTTTGSRPTTTTTSADGGSSSGGDYGNSGDTASIDAATVQVAEDPTLGKLLVGPNGHTLYMFEKDQGTTSACTGGCASTWPGLVASGKPTAGEGVDATKLSTVSGQVPNQVAYNGHLLYYFAVDTKAGDVKGADIPSWYAVDPGGNPIEAT